ncbi:isocitrate dehydrogenase [NAD] regulatory subunit 1, mitochondrial isoform X2 [Cryptomeria japonica]|uniref:isocitrate dehydrogenase [NAD] regulatory subunit 1, mitochondrial isoform X2 n=1 Tax=Cryptomeria japonica TaxID=3369 RepID=UPI0027DA3941|nr:isocitrate dehydrogenase [NAD] regulatory subunit 1, mitochondrial isoform X2 [Cryptomeria japonica]
MRRGAMRVMEMVRWNGRRGVTYMPRPGDGEARAVTMIPGDGIGPLVTGAVQQVMEAMHAPIFFETFHVSGNMTSVPSDVIDSIRKNKVCLKGGLATPVGGGVSSLNVQLRKELDLFASLVHCFTLPGLPTRHDHVDIVVIRENTEGEYSGLEHEVVPGVVESLKVITKFCSERIAKYAFEYAYLNNRKTVTAVHKANIMKLADGLFLESCREVAKKYPGIKYNEIIVDNCCMQLVSKPEQFDVMAPNGDPGVGKSSQIKGGLLQEDQARIRATSSSLASTRTTFFGQASSGITSSHPAFQGEVYQSSYTSKKRKSEQGFVEEADSFRRIN